MGVYYKTYGMRQLEQEHAGQDIRDIIGAAFLTAGTMEGAALHLHRTRQTLKYWLDTLGGRFDGDGINKVLIFDGYERRFGHAVEAEG
jgi:hypothetical protein